MVSKQTGASLARSSVVLTEGFAQLQQIVGEGDIAFDESMFKANGGYCGEDCGVERLAREQSADGGAAGGDELLGRHQLCPAPGGDE